MLIILYGPSCTGKSTIIQKLVNEYNCKQINCYTTRQSRINDNARISVTFEEFKKMEINNNFIFVNYHYNTYYGTPKNEIENAINDKDNFFVLDYMLKNRHHLEKYNYKKFIIIPDTIKSLELWVIGSTRIERLEEIKKDFTENYNDEILNSLKVEGYNIIINGYGLLDAITKEIYELSKIN